METKHGLANLRRKSWVVKKGVMLKRVSNIQTIMSNLSTFRKEALIPPFSNTGIDLFGP